MAVLDKQAKHGGLPWLNDKNKHLSCHAATSALSLHLPQVWKGHYDTFSI
jgi:hypothetical protein